jgi:tetratricopeptide (TPR) repeat protein
VPFDREGTLRKAEKLLRQGKLDLAIAEYRSVIEDQPADWNTANTLGDLYFRAGNVEKAVAEYNKIADHFANEGFLPKAVALYRKILKIKPDEERAMWHLGGISARQGLLADARSNFLTLAERRRVRGDRRGEAEVRLRLGDLDGADVEARLAGAHARVELGDPMAAVERLKQGASELQDKGKEADALYLLTEAAKIDPADAGLRHLLLQAFAARGDFEAARQYATSASELTGVADELLRQGREDEGISVLVTAADVDPSDTAIRARLARLFLGRGDLAAARNVLTPQVAGSDPGLLWTLAEMELRDGRIAEGTALLQQILAEDPSRRDALVILGCKVAEVNSDAGYECIEVVARAAIAADEWGSAAAAVNEFVNRVPNHIPALMRLVEICVDGGLEATMHSAQAQLADAYLVVGAGLEARVIAEDLVAREPWERANIERFRRALALLGENDIDAIIAERLSGQSPFTSTDFLWPIEPAGTEMAPTPMVPEPAPVARAAEAEPVARHAEAAPEAHVPETPPAPKAPARDMFSLGPSAIDMRSIFEDTGREESAPAAKAESHEVDLSDVLHDMRTGEAKMAAGPVAPAANIEGVRKGTRDEAGHDSSPETAEQQFNMASTYIQMGMQDEAMKALEAAARSPRHRFKASAMLGKMYLERGDRQHGIEWYERAAEAPSPSAESTHALLYDLATALEDQGESARALAVFLELQAEAGDYRDLPARLEHLFEVRAKG